MVVKKEHKCKGWPRSIGIIYDETGWQDKLGTKKIMNSWNIRIYHGGRPLPHWEYIQIKVCPFCGRKLKIPESLTSSQN